MQRGRQPRKVSVRTLLGSTHADIDLYVQNRIFVYTYTTNRERDVYEYVHIYIYVYMYVLTCMFRCRYIQRDREDLLQVHPTSRRKQRGHIPYQDSLIRCTYRIQQLFNGGHLTSLVGHLGVRLGLGFKAWGAGRGQSRFWITGPQSNLMCEKHAPLLFLFGFIGVDIEGSILRSEAEGLCRQGPHSVDVPLDIGGSVTYRVSCWVPV